MTYSRMKPQRHERRERNQAIYEYHRTHPETTLDVMGQIFGLSHQRIHAILRQAKRHAR